MGDPGLVLLQRSGGGAARSLVARTTARPSPARKRPMTAQRFNYCLDKLRISQRLLAAWLDCSYRLPNEWGVGRQSIPVEVAAWLERCMQIRNDHPDPKIPLDWRRRSIPAPARKAPVRKRKGARKPA